MTEPMKSFNQMFVPHAKLGFDTNPFVQIITDTNSLLSIAAHTEGSALYLTLQGELSIETLEILERTIAEGLLDPSCTEIVANLNGVSYLDAAGISVFVGAVASLRKRVGLVHLVDCSPAAKKVITITHLTKIFRMYDTSDAARKALGVSTWYGDKLSLDSLRDQPTPGSFRRVNSGAQR